MSGILAEKRSKHKTFSAYQSKLIFFSIIEQYLVVAKQQATKAFPKYNAVINNVRNVNAIMSEMIQK